jgi:hypothetical protein
MKPAFQSTKLSEIADLKDSLHQTPEYADEGYPMVRVCVASLHACQNIKASFC